MIKVIKNSRQLILFCLLLTSSLTFSQTRGSTYTGQYKKSEPIELKRQSNIIIEGLEFDNSEGRSIVLWNCTNVTVRNCKFKNNFKDRSIYAYEGKNILVTNCYFENIHQGFVADKCLDNIKFVNNDVKNLVGNLYGGTKFANAVSIIKSNGAGYSISYNAIENIPEESAPEDIINIYQSSGTASSPITIKGNWIRGGGPSPSGGGIMLADGSGRYQVAEDNILVNPGMYGIGVVGGQYNVIRNNKIYSKKLPHSGLAIQAADYTPDVSGPAANIVVENNEFNYTNSRGLQEPSWFQTEMRKVVKNWATSTVYKPSLNEDILPEVIINQVGNKNNGVHKKENRPEESETPITQVYTDSFNRIAIKYFASPIPHAYGELFTSTGQRLDALVLPRFNTVFPLRLTKGNYYVRITYKDLNKTEINKITIN